MHSKAYEQGFLNKCAEYGVDARQLRKRAQNVTLQLAPTGSTAVGMSAAKLVGDVLRGAAFVGGGYAGYRGVKHLIDRKRTKQEEQE